MKKFISGREQDVTQVTPKLYRQLLEDVGNRYTLAVYGKSGYGKSQIAEGYAEDMGLKTIIFSLATEMPENIGGLPYVVQDPEEKATYFKRLMDERLAPVFKTKGKGYMIIFDEINQGSAEVLNALYPILYSDPKYRNWHGHSLEFAQVVTTGNLDNGEDHTVYLTTTPTPLDNRCWLCELIYSKEDTMEYLRTKWKNIPLVTKYITALLDENIPPRDIDNVLSVLAFNTRSTPLLLSMKLGTALSTKVMNIQQKIKTADPAQTLKLCKESYAILKRDGMAKWAGEIIETEEELIEKFRDILSDEEIQAIVKGE